jgi:uncharacterized membrane protein
MKQIRNLLNAKVKKIFIFLFFLSIFFVKPQFSFAEVIHNFDVNINAHKDGSMNITETINYDFENEYRHGIYRDIPLFSAVGNLYKIIKIKNVNVSRDSQSENFKLSSDSSNLNIKIGNANANITGSHTYIISYKVTNGIGSNFADHDEIYWNATGNNWKVNIEKASVKITTDFEEYFDRLICFEGISGSKNQTCNILNNTSESSQILSPGSGLTIVATYPVNTFPKSILVKNPYQQYFDSHQPIEEKVINFIKKNYIYFSLFLNFIIAPYLFYWYLKHKNKKRFGSPAVNFDIPKDESGQIIRPALAGIIDNAKLEANDVAATVFDLAIRRYIKLEETKTSIKFFPDIKDQKIIKLKDADENLNSYERILFDKLFAINNICHMSDLKTSFYPTFLKIEKEIFNNLIDNGYYIKNPKLQKVILIILAISSLLSLNIILSLVLFFLSIKLNGRTEQGDEIDFKIDGLKVFLKSMNENYKWQTKNLYTVEQMIPYAMALGLIDQFMEQLKIIEPNYSPAWCRGYQGSFYSNYLAFYSGMTINMTTTSSSGLSGGFSGGGGGGGGGGSW